MLLILLTLLPFPKVAAGSDLSDVKNIVVLYLENRSFDHLFGLFPGTDGLGNSVILQTDLSGRVYDSLPPFHDPRFPDNLPNQPFLLDDYITPEQYVTSPDHSFLTSQGQINGGKNDHFVAMGGVGALPMGYHDGRKTKLWRWAERFTLLDHFFQAAYGGSFLNHQWLICACTPIIAGDSPVVNTIESSQFHRLGINIENTLPPLTSPTIGDRLSEKRIDWIWYSGGYAKASTMQPDPLFQYHHQPFTYYKRYQQGSGEASKHLRDEADFLADIKKGTLPPVAFYKPNGDKNEHAGYANLQDGDDNIDKILSSLERSPQWSHMVVVVTYDEYGGWYDHISPPKGDRWGPGSRIPAIIISPFAKRNMVDHRIYDTTSILALIEKRWNLAPLSSRDAAADPLSGAFSFSATIDHKKSGMMP